MITKDELSHLSDLSKIEMSNDDLGSYAADMSEIIDLMDQIKAVDTSSIDISLSPNLPKSQLREDVIGISLTNSEALNNAPLKDKGLFSVAKVVE